MVAIGRGLMAKPSLLMMDEPSLGLAPLIVTDLFRTVSEINHVRASPSSWWSRMPGMHYCSQAVPMSWKRAVSPVKAPARNC